MEKKAPRRITAQYLENAALHYLERFATSSENLRRVLTRKVQRSASHHGDDPAEGAAWVAALVERYCATGLLDDATYAQARSRSLHRRGGSTRSIRQTLMAKGLDAEAVDGALAGLHDDAGDPDAAAAQALCRRRRLGPYRAEDKRAEMRLKDLATLARAGFSFAVAKAAVDGEED